ncbi:MAG: hypothetical protein QM589_07565 [Thermomicrobiales bacterium]
MDLTIEPDKPGPAVNLAATEQQTRAILADLIPATIDLPTTPIAPTITASDLETYRDTAAALIADPVTIADDATNQSWAIGPDQLAQALMLPTADVAGSPANPMLDGPAQHRGPNRGSPLDRSGERQRRLG